MLKAARNKPLKTRILRGFVLSAVVAALVFFTPTPYKLQAPGQVENVGNIISLDTQTYPSEGAFLLPTVVSEPASLLYCLYSLIEPDAVLTTDGATEPQAQSPGGGRQMALSQYLSTRVALDAVGHDVGQDFLGLRILLVDPRSPNIGVLKTGDLLTSLDGLSLASFWDFKRVVSEKKPGQVFPASVTRNEEQITLDLDVVKHKGRSLIGVTLRPEIEQAALPFDVSFKSGKTIGA